MTAVNCSKKAWESDFFNKAYYELSISSSGEMTSLGESIDKLIGELDYDLIECNLDLEHIQYAKILENIGFRLVDSRMQFITEVKRSDKRHFFENPFEQYKIEFSTAEDAEAIQRLTREFIVGNNNLVSRYKDLNYFKKGDAESYFTTWIKYCLAKENAIITVAKVGEEVAGFFIYEDKGAYLEKKLYKGILCAVDRPHHGKKLHLSMQSFLFNNFEEEEFFIDNTTQLSNYPIVKNHIRSQRNLQQMSLTFMLKNETVS